MNDALSSQDTSLSIQTLIFNLNSTWCGIPLSAVQEITPPASVTAIPRSAPFVRGIMNIRGAVVPLIDLRIKFGLSRSVETSETLVILLKPEIFQSQNSENFSEKKRIALLVDSIQNIYSLSTQEKNLTKDTNNFIPEEFIEHIFLHSENPVFLLNIRKLIESEPLVLGRKV